MRRPAYSSNAPIRLSASSANAIVSFAPSAPNARPPLPSRCATCPSSAAPERINARATEAPQGGSTQRPQRQQHAVAEPVGRMGSGPFGPTPTATVARRTPAGIVVKLHRFVQPHTPRRITLASLAPAATSAPNGSAGCAQCAAGCRGCGTGGGRCGGGCGCRTGCGKGCSGCAQGTGSEWRRWSGAGAAPSPRPKATAPKTKPEDEDEDEDGGNEPAYVADMQEPVVVEGTPPADWVLDPGRFDSVDGGRAPGTGGGGSHGASQPPPLDSEPRDPAGRCVLSPVEFVPLRGTYGYELEVTWERKPGGVWQRGPDGSKHVVRCPTGYHTVKRTRSIPIFTGTIQVRRHWVPRLGQSGPCPADPPYGEYQGVLRNIPGDRRPVIEQEPEIACEYDDSVTTPV